MACYRPIEGYRRTDGAISFKRDSLTTGQLMAVPCGRCIGCRLDRSKQWAVRCVHENMMHDESCFLTLTYDDKHLPPDESVSRVVHQRFMKRLRKEVSPKKLRFYMCGEYGEKLARPHYHYLIFGHQFKDRYYWTTHNGHKYYRSATLEKVWPYGHALIGNVTLETAAYTARYVLKKFTGPDSPEHYAKVTRYGELVTVEPEFCLMSLKPGIGKEWFEKYGQNDVYDTGDFVAIGGRKYRTPKYYDKLLGDLDERELLRVKRERKIKAQPFAANNTPERLRVREVVQTERAKKLIRGYEK